MGLFDKLRRKKFKYNEDNNNYELNIAGVLFVCEKIQDDYGQYAKDLAHAYESRLPAIVDFLLPYIRDKFGVSDVSIIHNSLCKPQIDLDKRLISYYEQTLDGIHIIDVKFSSILTDFHYANVDDMNIIIDRDSACMSDDVYSHVKRYRINDNATYEDFMFFLKKDHYFPHISGNNVVWVLTTKNIDYICSYFTLTNKFILQGLIDESLYKICNEISHTTEFHIKYYSSPLRWKEKIYSLYQGNEYCMWRDGWLEEIKYCDYIEEIKKKL